MSFHLTTPQMRARTKTVTRRLGWKNLKPGTLLQACEKCQGLKKGEHPVKICVIRVKRADREPLYSIYSQPDDCAREGFPELTPRQFVLMFMLNMGCGDTSPVTRIEFEYV